MDYTISTNLESFNTIKIDNVLKVFKNKYIVKGFKVIKLDNNTLTFDEAITCYGKLLHIFYINNIEVYHFKDKRLGHSYCTKIAGVFGFPYPSLNSLLYSLNRA